jgi:hypothetical protein
MRTIQANQDVLADLNFSLHGLDSVSTIKLPVQQLRKFVNCPSKDGMSFETFDYLTDLYESEDLSEETEIILYV